MMSWSKRSKDDSEDGDGDDSRDYPILPAGKTMDDIEQAVSCLFISRPGGLFK